MHFNALPAEALAPIRARFLVALRDRAERVGEAASTARSGEPDTLYQDIHKIRGVAPMLGMGQLGALAADAETRLEAWLASALPHPAPQPAMPRMPEDLHVCLKALHAAIREALA